MITITIYKPSGDALTEAVITKDAERVRELMTSDYIKLSWYTTGDIGLTAGCYIVWDDIQYTLIEAYTPTQKSTGSFLYEPEFVHPFLLLSKTPFYYDTYDAYENEIREYDWALTSYCSVMFDLICEQINEYFGIDTDTDLGWGYVIGELDGTTATVSFADVDIISAIGEVCDAFNADWYADWDARVIYVAKGLATDTGGIEALEEDEEKERLLLEVGTNVDVPNVTSSAEGYYNCFIPKGSTRNISQPTASGENASTGVRLTLDPETYPDGMIDMRDDENEPKLIKILAFDDIYPHLDLYCYNVRESERYVTDEDGSKVATGSYDDDGNVIYDTFSVWYMKLAYPTYDEEGNITEWNDFDLSSYSEAPFVTADNPHESTASYYFIDCSDEWNYEYFTSATGEYSSASVVCRIGDDVTFTAKACGYNSESDTTRRIRLKVYKTAIDFDELDELLQSTTQVFLVNGVERDKFPTSMFEEISTDSIILDGYTPCVSFIANENGTHSALAGREFEITYHTSPQTIAASKCVSGESFSVEQGDYEIVYETDSENNDLIIPTTSEQGIIPYGEDEPSLECDMCILYNIAMDDEYYTQAYQELYEAAIEEIGANYSDQNQYTFNSYPTVFEQDTPNIYPSRIVKYSDGQGYTLLTRVTKVVTKLDFEFEQEITVGNVDISKKLDTLSEDVETANKNINIISNISSSSTSSLTAMKKAILKLIDDLQQQIDDLTEASDDYLSSVDDDTAEGEITFNAGIKFGTSGSIDESGNASLGNVSGSKGAFTGNVAVGNDLSVAGDASVDGDLSVGDDITVEGDITSTNFDEAAQKGFVLSRNADTGSYTLKISNIEVWGKATFNELEVRKVSAIGGSLILSPAASKIIIVDAFMYSERLSLEGGDIGDEEDYQIGWKCFYLADDGTTATSNTWVKGDQARCQSFNQIDSAGTYDDAANKDYWRLVIAVSTENEAIYDADGNELYDGELFGWVALSLKECQDGDLTTLDETDDDYSESLYKASVPASGDAIACLGHQNQISYTYDDDGNITGTEEEDYTNRMHAIVLSSASDDGATTIYYRNINSFSLEGCIVEYHCPGGQSYVYEEYFSRITGSGKTLTSYTYEGTWVSGTTVYYGQYFTYNGDLWLWTGDDGVTPDDPSEDVDGWVRMTYTSVGSVIEIKQSLGGFIYPDEEETVTLSVRDYSGNDKTDEYTFTVKRDSGDESDDAVWNAETDHLDCGTEFTIGYDDLNITARIAAGSVTTTFYIYATAADGTVETSALTY